MPWDIRLDLLLQYFGANLARLRRRARRTQSEMAAHIHCSVRYYQKLEHGKVTPSLSLVVHIAQALGVEERELFTPQPPAKPRRGRPRKQASNGNGGWRRR